MAKESAGGGCGPEPACCRMEAVVSVDERGQLVLPKHVRTRLGLEAGDKLAVVTYGEGAGTCCIALVRADRLAEAVRDMLGPLLEGR
ncbi:MAG: AbrB/MazE/SpoVT family DNA-binding domain-containing protein [Coriobacteriia bacterium]|nr:AbrB/MazE/SpoVT family DNA-binding domain-containing protein [Coriobacteriia bacterium]